MSRFEDILKDRARGFAGQPAAPPESPISEDGPVGDPLTARDASEVKAILDDVAHTILTLDLSVADDLFGKPESAAARGIVDDVIARIIAARLVIAAVFADQPYGFACRVVYDQLDLVENHLIGALVTQYARETTPAGELIQQKGIMINNALGAMRTIAEFADELARTPERRVSIASMPEMQLTGGDITFGYGCFDVFTIEGMAGARTTDVMFDHASPLNLFFAPGGDTLRKFADFFLRAISKSIRGKVSKNMLLQQGTERGTLSLTRSMSVAIRRSAGLPLMSETRVLFGMSTPARNAWKLMETADTAQALESANEVIIHEAVTDNIGVGALNQYILRMFSKTAQNRALLPESVRFIENARIAARVGLYEKPIAWQSGFVTRKGDEEMALYLSRQAPVQRERVGMTIEAVINTARRGMPGAKYVQRYSELLQASDAFVIGKGKRLSQLSEIARSAKEAEALVARELDPILKSIPEVPVDRAIEPALIAATAGTVMEGTIRQSMTAALKRLGTSGRKEIIEQMSKDAISWNDEVGRFAELAQQETLTTSRILDETRALDDLALRVRRGFETLSFATTAPNERAVLSFLENTIVKRIEMITGSIRAQRLVQMDARVLSIGAGLFLGGLAVSNEAIAEVNEDPSSGDFFMMHARTSKETATIAKRFFGNAVFGTDKAVDEITNASNAVDEASAKVTGAVELGTQEDIADAAQDHRNALLGLKSTVERNIASEGLNPVGVMWAEYLLRLGEADVLVTSAVAADREPMAPILSKIEEEARAELTRQMRSVTTPEDTSVQR